MSKTTSFCTHAKVTLNNNSTRQLRVSVGDDDDNDNTIDGAVIEMLQWKNDPKKMSWERMSVRSQRVGQG